MTDWAVEIVNAAKSDLKKLKQAHLDGRFLQIVATLKADPYRPTDGFKKLQPPSAGRYSRRLNRVHRVVYRIDDERRVVTIYSAWTHDG